MFQLIVLLVAVSTVMGAQPGPLQPGILLNYTRPAGAKIIGGTQANQGQFPYLVSLNYQGDGHACGASVLTPNFVLTAAHCCLTGSAMEIYAGSILLSSGGVKYPISTYFIHGDYDDQDHWANDICVIKMASPIQLNAQVAQVSLPPQDMAINSGDTLVIPGWGVDANGNGPDRLQVLLNDKALSNNECSAKTGFTMNAGQLCTYGGNAYAVCSGDSGGPLTRNGVQVGITSWVYLPCGATGMPDVFTRVPRYVDWISQVLGSEAKDLKFATAEQLA